MHHIGEVYHNCEINYDGRKGFWVYRFMHEGSSDWRFTKITKYAFTDEVDNKVKIYNKWFDRSQVFFYDDVHEPLREKIRNNTNKYLDNKELTALNGIIKVMEGCSLNKQQKHRVASYVIDKFSDDMDFLE